MWILRVDPAGAWHAAGGVAGDLCCSIDDVPASQALAELAAGTRPRLADTPIAVEIERPGERLTIHPCWREIAYRETEVSAGDSDAVRTLRILKRSRPPGPPPTRPLRENDALSWHRRPVFANLPQWDTDVGRDTHVLPYRENRRPRRPRSAIDPNYNPFADVDR